MLPKLYSGQKAIRTIKAESNKDNPYSIFNMAALEGAMKRLKPNAFKLWCYLNRHQTNYEFGLSAVDACQACGIAKNTYLAAVKELIEKGYLVEVELYENLTGYLFIESGYGGEEKS